MGTIINNKNFLTKYMFNPEDLQSVFHGVITNDQGVWRAAKPTLPLNVTR